jgi:hypothetical protein
MKCTSRVKLYLCSFFLFVGGETFAQDPNFQIYLCFGQSNMAGAGTIETQDRTVDSRFQVMEPMDCSSLSRTFGKWYPAVPPLWGCTGGLGPADYFGRTMVQTLPTTIKVGVIVIGIPGCDIALFNKTGFAGFDEYNYVPSKYNGSAYAWLLELAKLAQKDGVIKGFLMHQGETMPDSLTWTSLVKGVYNNLLSDLGLEASKTPLLAGELLYPSAGGTEGGHNQYIAKLPSVIPNSYVISASGLAGKDQYHFNSASERTFGARYATKMLTLLESSGVNRNDLTTPNKSSFSTIRPFTFSGGAVQIKSESNFNYRITNIVGAQIEAGSGIGALTVGANISSGIYFISIDNKIGSFKEKFFKK